jgi:hypothetical protein
MALNQYLEQSIKLPEIQVKEVQNNPVSDIPKGGLLSDLKITKQGKIIGVRSDWESIDVSAITYIAVDTLFTDSAELFSAIKIGDKVWIKQLNVDKYFYVIDKDSTTNYIYLNGGDNYSYTSDNTEFFGFSDEPSPSGHPLMFYYSTGDVYVFETGGFTWQWSTTEFGGAFGSYVVSYYMNGPIATIGLKAGTVALPACNNVLFLLPFRDRIDPPFENVVAKALLTDGTTTIPNQECFIQYGGSGGTGLTFDRGIFVVTPGGSEFNSGTWGIGNTFTVVV